MRLSPTPRAPRLGRSGLILSFYGVLAVTAVVWGALRGHANIIFYSGPAHGPAQVISSLSIGIALGLLIVLLTRIVQEHFAWARMLHNEFRHLLGPLHPRDMMVLAAASSIGEEFFFRGALLSHLLALFPGALGIGFAIFGSALIFALLHIGPGTRFLPWTLSSLGVGVLLASVYVGMGDLIGPIAIHFTVNFLNLKDINRRQLEA